MDISDKTVAEEEQDKVIQQRSDFYKAESKFFYLFQRHLYIV